LLKQFYKTLLGFTNLRDLRKSTGEKICGIIEDDKDWDEEWDIVLCTYQQFIREKGFDRLKKHVVGKFGVLIIDEAHRSSAGAYVNFVSKLNMKYKIGMTATVHRKDGKEFLTKQVIGPVVAESDTVAMTPEVDVIYTHLKAKGGFRGRAAYTYANLWLSKNPDRKKMIVKQIFKDLRENPKHCIVIPVMFTAQIRNMVKLINEQAVYNNVNKGEKWDENLAVAYYDDKKKQQSQTLDEVRRGDKTRVLIGIRKMLKEGIDVPAWTHMYLTFPMNNEPDFYQMSQRIATPYEGKPQPILRIFVDEIPLSERCFLSTYHHINKHKYPYTEKSGEVISFIFDKQKPKDKTDDW